MSAALYEAFGVDWSVTVENHVVGMRDVRPGVREPIRKVELVVSCASDADSGSAYLSEGDGASFAAALVAALEVLRDQRQKDDARDQRRGKE